MKARAGGAREKGVVVSLSRSCRVLAGIAVLAAVLVASPGARAENGINAVGTLERFPQEAFDAFGPEIRPEGPLGHKAEIVGGTLIPVPGAGQIWQLYNWNFELTTGVLVRDARNLKVIG